MRTGATSVEYALMVGACFGMGIMGPALPSTVKTRSEHTFNKVPDDLADVVAGSIGRWLAMQRSPHDRTDESPLTAGLTT